MNKEHCHSSHPLHEEIPLEVIATVSSPYSEKFTVPRQPGLVPSVTSSIIMRTPFCNPDAFNGLEEFSHIWILFRFHQNLDQGWRPQVRPPRLGGNQKLGVFATRSSFRPNGFGISVVKLLDIKIENSEVQLDVSGLDVVDGTPVYDIKPYVSYTDAIPDAKSGFAPQPPQKIEVQLSKNAQQQLTELSPTAETIRQQLIETLAQDPRPAYRKAKLTDDNEYGVSFSGFNFRWRVETDKIVVFAVTPV